MPAMVRDPEGDLLTRARAVLDRNRAGAYTCPSVRLYPHQWLWDSCFTAIGIARFDASRAADELRALFRGQWDNGMLPHMIFAEGSRDVGSRRVWRSWKRAGAPRGVATSCITQPPIAAIAIERVADALPASERDAFVAELAPKVLEYHRWLFRERRLDGSPLITLIHPWECGLDSTPPWMTALGAMRMPWWVGAAEKLRLASLLRSLRYDTRQLPASERASDDDGLRMLALAVHLSHFDFDLARIPRVDRAVLVEDVAFNAFFAAANRSLQALVDDLGDLDPLVDAHADALELLWYPPRTEYCSRNAVTHAPMSDRSIATFLPLLTSDVHVDALVARLQDPEAYWPAYPVPSVPLEARHFQDHRYWAGPTWVNTNWAIVEALHRRGHDDVADDLRTRTLRLVEEHGFAEYFSPTTGTPHGAPEFSWTAALTIDLAYEASVTRA
jgi:Mannosylglycerate hydrolase MGH1-like glycoside hydrolase domain